MNKKSWVGWLLVFLLASATLAWAQVNITNGGMNQEPAMEIRNNGNLVVVFNSGGEPHGIFSSVSTDNGQTWSAKSFVGPAWDDVAITEDDTGRLVLLTIGEGLVTWTSTDGISWTNSGTVPAPINSSVGDILHAGNGYYYATYSDAVSHVFVTRSTDLVNWESAVPLSFGNNFEFDSSIMQASDGKLIIVYNSYTEPQGIYFVSSTDGVTWTQPQIAVKMQTNAHIGLNVLEVNGKPTMFFQSYSSGPGLYYSYLDGGNWSAPQRVYSNVPFGADVVPMGDRIGFAFARDASPEVREIYYDTVSLTQPSGCMPGIVQCDSSGKWTQKCNESNGEWFNAGYCPNGCQNGNCVEANQTQIRLGELFKLAIGQSAYYSNENAKQKIVVRLNAIDSKGCAAGCPSGQPCPPCEGGTFANLSVEDQVSGVGLGLSLKPGDSQPVFGFILSLKELASNSASAVLVLSEASGGGEGHGVIKVRLSEQFKLPKSVVALITENGETLSKLSLVGVSTSTNCPMPVPAPAPPTEVPKGFKNAKWECYDGKTNDEVGGETACKPPETWAEYANKQCANRCSSETGKCGVSSFSVSNDCGAVQQEVSSQPLYESREWEKIKARDCFTDEKGNTVCKKTSCGQSTVGNFVASTPKGTFEFSLRPGEKYEAAGLGYFLHDLFGGEKDYTAVMHVEKYGGSGEYKRVSLGVPFQVQPGDRVVVDETGLNLRIEKIYLENETVVFEAMQPIYAQSEYKTRAISVSPLTGRVTAGIGEAIKEEKFFTVAEPTAASIGKPIAVPSVSYERPVSIADVPYGGYYKANPRHPAQLFGQTVEVNWVKGEKGEVVAEMVVRKESGQDFIRVKLDKLFKLLLNNPRTAYVMDNGAETLRLTILGLSGPYKCQTEEKCFERPQAKIEISLQPTPCVSGKECATGVGMVTVLAPGETTQLGPYTIRLAYADSQVAAFVVSKGSETGDVQLVYLNQKFKLPLEKTAQVVGENTFLRMEKAEGEIAEVTVFRKGDYGTAPSMRVKVKPGSSFSAFGLQFNFIDWAEKTVGTWVAFKDESGTQNVPLGVQFTLLLGGTAYIPSANLQVQLLNIYQPGCENLKEKDAAMVEKCVENKKPVASIAVRSILGYEKEEIKKPQNEIEKEPVTIANIDPETIKKILTQVISKRMTAPIERAPAPQTNTEVFDLAEGEKAFYHGYEITARNIGYDRAGFVVDKKSETEPLVIYLEHGWNLFSIPKNMKVEKSDCKTPELRLYEYVDGKFVKVKDPKPYRGYWLYNKGDSCKVQAQYLDNESFKELKALQPGWNFVPVIGPMFKKTAFELGCTLRAAYAYEKGQWVSLKEKPFSMADLGKAFVAYSDSACPFSGEEEELVPPPLPSIDLTQEGTQ